MTQQAALDFALHLTGTPFRCCEKCDVCLQTLGNERITLMRESKDSNIHLTVCSPECFSLRAQKRWWMELGGEI